MTCSNRIKPKLLRDIKTEALLAFIRTTLEEYFKELDKGTYYFELSSKEDDEFIYKKIKKLVENLEDTVINSTYLRSLIENSNKSSTLKILAKKEESLMIYYNTLVKTIEVNLPNGSLWMPEFVVICLLNEWTIEEEKSTYFYPYLKNIDYADLINKYDKIKKNLDSDKREVIMNMYRISSKMIEKLKKVEYKINTSRKKMKRK